MRKTLIFILTLVLGLLAFNITPSKIQAADIGPDKYFIDINSTNQVNQILTIYGNPTATKSVKLYISALGMRKIGDQNDREFYEVDPNDPNEVANWITFDQTTAVVGPHDTVQIGWHLKPKSITSCGTNLGAIGVTEEQIPDNTVKGTVIGVKNITISQIHINVINYNQAECLNNKTNLGLLEFKVDSPIAIFNYDNIPFITRIKNEGRFIARKPEGFIEIFGVGEKITIPFNEKQLDIYAGTERRFDDVWIDPGYPKDGNFFEQVIYEASHLRIGKYEARLGITHNVTTQIIATATLWIIPWRIVLLIILIILIIVGILVLKSRGKKTKKTNKSKNK